MDCHMKLIRTGSHHISITREAENIMTQNAQLGNRATDACSRINLMNTDDVSPSRQQYLEIKRAHPNTILFFRLGDFYETFDEDAEITARELDIVLTSRTVGKGQRAPLAGIPYHAVENYLARLIEKGYHVAICE